MLVFGWICMIVLMLLGLLLLGILTGPFIIAKIRTFAYRVKRYIDDEKQDIEKRSEERKHRDEIKRQKDFELANKKLDAKLNKVDKQIKLQTEKLKLAEKLKRQTAMEKDELNEQSLISQLEIEEPSIEEEE